MFCSSTRGRFRIGFWCLDVPFLGLASKHQTLKRMASHEFTPGGSPRPFLRFWFMLDLKCSLRMLCRILIWWEGYYITHPMYIYVCLVRTFHWGTSLAGPSLLPHNQFVWVPGIKSYPLTGEGWPLKCSINCIWIWNMVLNFRNCPTSQKILWDWHSYLLFITQHNPKEGSWEGAKGHQPSAGARSRRS